MTFLSQRFLILPGLRFSALQNRMTNLFLSPDNNIDNFILSMTNFLAIIFPAGTWHACPAGQLPDPVPVMGFQEGRASSIFEYLIRVQAYHHRSEKMHRAFSRLWNPGCKNSESPDPVFPAAGAHILFSQAISSPSNAW